MGRGKEWGVCEGFEQGLRTYQSLCKKKTLGCRPGRVLKGPYVGLGDVGRSPEEACQDVEDEVRMKIARSRKT